MSDLAPWEMILECRIAARTIHSDRIHLVTSSTAPVRLVIETRAGEVDALFVPGGEGPLVVSFHGALNRDGFTLPRFEWLRTLKEVRVPQLFLSDPTLKMSDKLQLAWYTGSPSTNLFPALASVVRDVVGALNGGAALLVGSSGGGFAAIQTASFLGDSSVAVAFNAQTDIFSYLVGGVGYGAQVAYARHVMGVEDPESVRTGRPEWASMDAERYSACARFSASRSCRVVSVQNIRDFHFEQHYLPFRDAAHGGGNGSRMHLMRYDGAVGHAPPPPPIFLDGVYYGLRLLQAANRSV